MLTLQIDFKNRTDLLIVFIIIDTLLLLFFGRSYSKFVLFESIYLHDALTLIAFLISITVLLKNKNRVISIEVISLLSVVYLLYSFFKLNSYHNMSLYFIIRQFMIFGYLIFYYAIVKQIATNKKYLDLLFDFLILFSKISLLIQTIYVTYIFLFKNQNPLLSKYYFSPIIILGIIIFSAYTLYKYRGLKKWVLFIFTFIISLTTGHDSVYLSVFFLFIVNIFVQTNIKGKSIITLIFITTLTTLYFTAPTFHDANVEWRLYYWQHGFKRIVIDNYFLLGQGFGVEFFGEVQQNYLNDIMLRYNHHYILNEIRRYNTPFHNSFITMMYHIGGFILLLLILPFVLFLKKHILLNNSEKVFLFTALAGLTLFASFNVILELPHSSNIYWIVFFMFLNYCNLDQKNIESKK